MIIADIPHAFVHRCHLGTGRELVISEHFAHAIIVTGAPRKRPSFVAFTPAGLRQVAESLLRMADQIDAKAEGK